MKRAVYLILFALSIWTAAPEARSQPSTLPVDTTAVTLATKMHSGNVEAEASHRPSPQHHNRHHLSLWAAYGYDSMRLWGKTPDATLNQFGFSYSRLLLPQSRMAFYYQLSMNLYSRYTYPEFKPGRRLVSLSGLGFSPLGLKLNFASHRQVQPYITSSGGFMLLENPFPDERGTRFNFTFGAGTGIEIFVRPNLSISLGYRYYHLSNGESGQINPGIDSNSMYVAITLL